MQRRSELEPLIVAEWMKRPTGKRTENDVPVFCGHFESKRPDLLAFRASGDKYQALKSIFRRHIPGP